MVTLPKFKKTVGSTLSKLEKVQKSVLGVALAAGLVMGASVSGQANASVSISAATPVLGASSTSAAAPGALLLSPPVAGNDLLAYHYSHSSHASHASHSSHYSHYSSKY